MDKFFLYWKENKPGRKWNTSFDYHTRGGVVDFATNLMRDIAIGRGRNYSMTKIFDKGRVLAETDGPVNFAGHIFKIKIVVVE